MSDSTCFFMFLWGVCKGVCKGVYRGASRPGRDSHESMYLCSPMYHLND